MTKSLKERKAHLLKLIRSFDAAEDAVIGDVELDETDEQIPEELEADDLDVVDETDDKELVDAEDEIVDEDDSFDVADEGEEEAVAELPEDKDDDAIVSDEEEDDEDLSFLDDEQDSVTASEVEIGDEAHGGDPSVSEITDSEIDVNTDAEVFPTDSEYVAKITAKLDKVASYLEKTGRKRMAYRLDVLSDKLEQSVRK